MRVSREKTESNRKNVVDVAGRLFKQNGFDGIGLTALMKGAGLTQGGFYKQFRSKDALMAEASATALKGGAELWRRLASETEGKPLDTIVDFYLSTSHRDEKAKGCTLAALAPEADRHGEAVQEAFTDGVKAHLDLLDELIDREARDAARETSMVTLATMVGSLILSRVVSDPELAEQILDASRKALLQDEAGHAERAPS